MNSVYRSQYVLNAHKYSLRVYSIRFLFVFIYIVLYFILLLDSPMLAEGLIFTGAWGVKPSDPILDQALIYFVQFY